MRRCELCGYHLDMHSELCERIQKAIARAEKAEAENAQLKSWLDAVTDFAYYEEDHLEAKYQYEKWREGQKNG